MPLATRTQPGAVSAADQANIERLSRIPTPTTADSGEVLGVNAAGDYALQDATPAYTLPMRLRDFNLDLTGDGYVLQANAVARSRSNTAYTLTLAAPLVYANSYMPSPRVANSHYAFRLPADTAIDMAEVRIGEADGVTGLFTRMDLSDATALGTQGGFDYYSLQIDDVPVGDSLTVVILDPVEIDFSKVEALNLDYRTLTNRPTIPSPTAGGGTTGLQIHTGAGVGVSVTDSSSTARIRLQLFSPVFDLDTASNQGGALLISGTLTLTGRSQTSIGFDQATTAQDLEVDFSTVTFASVIRATTTYADNRSNGHLVYEDVIHNGSATIGTYRLYLARDASNQLGYYAIIEQGGGTLSYTVALSDFEVGFIHTDTGAALSGITTIGDQIATWTGPISDTPQVDNRRYGGWSLTSTPHGATVETFDSVTTGTLNLTNYVPTRGTTHLYITLQSTRTPIFVPRPVIINLGVGGSVDIGAANPSAVFWALLGGRIGTNGSGIQIIHSLFEGLSQEHLWIRGEESWTFPRNYTLRVFEGGVYT